MSPCTSAARFGQAAAESQQADENCVKKLEEQDAREAKERELRQKEEEEKAAEREIEEKEEEEKRAKEQMAIERQQAAEAFA